MHVIVAASDPDTRAILRARLAAVGLPCDEEVASRSMLRASLDLSERTEATLVVHAAQETADFAQLALDAGVPALAWPTHRDARTRSVRRLTAREREILALVALGTSNKAIGRALRISPNTVKFHLASMFGKLGVATRAEAIAAAARVGELSL